jgi:hypothetical protein
MRCRRRVNRLPIINDKRPVMVDYRGASSSTPRLPIVSAASRSIFQVVSAECRIIESTHSKVYHACGELRYMCYTRVARLQAPAGSCDG